MYFTQFKNIVFVLDSLPAPNHRISTSGVLLKKGQGVDDVHIAIETSTNSMSSINIRKIADLNNPTALFPFENKQVICFLVYLYQRGIRLGVILKGSPGSGKSTIMECVGNILGKIPDYTAGYLDLLNNCSYEKILCYEEFDMDKEFIRHMELFNQIEEEEKNKASQPNVTHQTRHKKPRPIRSPSGRGRGGSSAASRNSSSGPTWANDDNTQSPKDDKPTDNRKSDSEYESEYDSDGEEQQSRQSKLGDFINRLGGKIGTRALEIISSNTPNIKQLIIKFQSLDPMKRRINKQTDEKIVALGRRLIEIKVTSATPESLEDDSKLKLSVDETELTAIRHRLMAMAKSLIGVNSSIAYTLAIDSRNPDLANEPFFIALVNSMDIIETQFKAVNIPRAETTVINPQN
jgi:hypothetical protein